MKSNQATAQVAKQHCAIPVGLQDAALVGIGTVKSLTGFNSSTSIYSRMRDGRFPKAIHLSSRCTRWRLRDIREWLESQGT